MYLNDYKFAPDVWEKSFYSLILLVDIAGSGKYSTDLGKKLMKHL